MSELIRLVVNYDYVRDQVKRFVSDIDLHIGEHLKIILQESMRYPISNEERKKITASFLVELDRCIVGMSKRVGYVIDKYVDSSNKPMYDEQYNVTEITEITEPDIKVED